MSAEKFLDRVAQTGLVDDALTAKMRKRLAGEPKSAEELAKMLVKAGHLTQSQATRLLGDLAEAKPSDERAAPKKSGRPAGGAAEKDPRAKKKIPEEEELGLAPLDEDEAPQTPAPSAAADDEVVLLEDASTVATPDLGLAPIEPEPAPARAPARPKPAGKAGLEPVPAVSGLEPLDTPGGLEPIALGGLQPIGAPGGLEPLSGAAGPEPLAAGGLEPLGDEFGAADRTVQRQVPRAARPPQRHVFDTKLMLLGGGLLLFLLMLGPALYFMMTGQTAAEMLQAADEDYRAQSYSQAIAKYEKFIAAFPKDEKVSFAKVRIGTARLWQAVEGSKDKQAALKMANEILPQIEQEKMFDQVRSELASILPEIAEGFAAPAKLEPDVGKAQQLVDRAEEAMKLVNNPVYIPTSIKNSITGRLETINEDLDLAKRNINQTTRLNEAVAAIRKAADAGQTVEAFATRRTLLKEYPALERNPALLEAVQVITNRERDLVKVVEQPLAALTEDHPRVAEFQVALASRRGQGATGSEKQIVAFLARGAVYGLKAATGQLAWRRAVGFETLAQPQPLTRQAGGDLIAVDARRNELLRLNGGTGALVWRTPVGESMAEPVLHGKRILVATRTGRLLDVDAETGGAARHALIPQSLCAGPGIGESRQFYQVGEHSNLYVLDESTLACKEVYYLGHKPGTMVVPPVLVLGHLIIAENSGPDYCDLHILATDANGLSVKPAMKPIRLSGRIMVAPLVSGARVIVVTDLGGIRILEVNAANPNQPVVDAVEGVVASFKSPLVGYSVYDRGALWVGNDRFTKYDVQASRARMQPQWIKDERDTFVAPPQVIGDNIYHLRRRKESPAYTATAVQGDDGKVLWEVDLALPTALLTVDMQRKQIHSVCAQAELFEVTADVFQTGHVDQVASAAVGAARGVPFDESIPMAAGRWALASPLERHRVVLYDPNAASATGRLIAQPLKAAGDAKVTATPVCCNGGLLLPLDNGQVELVDPGTGERKILPFQPRVEAGRKVQWRRPAVVGAEGKEFVVADDQGKLYRVGVKDQPQPHLAELAAAQLEMKIDLTLAAAGDAVYAVVRGPTADTVVAFATADLAAGKEWPLEGRVVWGPESVGAWVLVATDRQGLLCFEAGQKQRWTSPLAYGPLAGRPAVQDQDLILSSLSGVVWRISGNDGKELKKIELGEPLGSGPVAFGNRLLLAGADGTLLVISAL